MQFLLAPSYWGFHKGAPPPSHAREGEIQAKDRQALKHIEELALKVVNGERRALSRAITLVESARADHQEQAQLLLDEVGRSNRQALRIGLSGTPGVGKSTFIEAFGSMLTAQDLRVAVLAVDPSSTRSGGSILGDKTRMDRLSRDKNAFIRPSPSQSHLGGVGRRTRAVVALCEAAGFDVILIETVGVGQSETKVAEMSDIFTLLLAPAGGDELQGVKRGIMEIADIILVNKADGELKPQAIRTTADYAGALRLLRKRVQDPDGFPKAQPVSALEEQGLVDVWQDMQKLSQWRKDHGHWDKTRARQSVHWFEEAVFAGLRALLDDDVTTRDHRETLAQDVLSGRRAPDAAAADLLSGLRRESRT